ncbi:MAG: ABC transporter permease [Acholeplasmataceae bacterium]
MSEKQLDKNLFKLASGRDFGHDAPFQTKPIGYYKDAWNRFKKNKASLVAGIILLTLIFMSIIGPLIRPDNFRKKHVMHAQRLSNTYTELPPYIKALSWIPLFDGKRTIVTSNAYALQQLDNPEIIDRYGKILYTNLDTLKPAADSTYKVRVQFYNYVNYKLSNEPTTLTTEELQAAYDAQGVEGLGRMVTKEVRVYKEADGSLTPGQSHRVHIEYFDFLDEVLDFKPEYWFGVNGNGYDWFTLLWSGARVSLIVAFVVASVNIIIGLIVGSISGYYGGRTDLIIQRIIEILAGIPFLALISLLVLRFGSSIFIVILAFTLTGWLGIQGTTRTQFYRYKGREYVLAARTLGASDFRIMTKHILPNAIGTLITSFVLYIPSVIFTESTFSYLGIINYTNMTSVGRMLADAQSRLRDSTSLAFLMLFPAVFVSLLMLSFNLFGNGLRDAFNPSLRGVE